MNNVEAGLRILSAVVGKETFLAVVGNRSGAEELHDFNCS
jgi:hypothetical protein